jgi:hypothetical protein
MLVGCVLPSGGLMRFWPASIVGPWRHMQDRPTQFDQLLAELNLPDWFWTSFPEGAETVSERGAEDVVQLFYSRIPADMPFWSTWLEMVWHWWGPTLGWGVFFVAVFGSVLGISFILRRQWVENERIAFPIAQVQMALVEQPQAGAWLNSTFRARSFWIAVGVMLLIRALTGLNQYWPKYFEEIPLEFNLREIFADPPWAYMDHYVSAAAVFPLVVALMFFVSSRIALSLWGFVILWQGVMMGTGSVGYEITRNDRRDINLGALLAFALMILWTGRRHYTKVIRLMFMPAREGEETGLFMHYRTAGWLAGAGAIGAIAWLMHVGMSFGGAFLLIVGLLTIWLVMANVVAHSGFLSPATLSGPREWFLDIYRNPEPAVNYSVTDVANHFHAQKIGGMWAYTPDQLGVYATHGLRVASEYARDAGRGLIIAMVLALLVGFFVAQTSTLYCYYAYGSTQDRSAQTPINAEVLNGQPEWTVNHTMRMHEHGHPPIHPTWWDFKWVVGSFSATGVLAFLQLSYAWWPLHPIGLLMLFPFSMGRLWFSIFLGWLIKVLIVRFGGASLFISARPFFMGVIIGEVLSAGIYALLAALLWSLGIEYQTVRFLPTSQF